MVGLDREAAKRSLDTFQSGKTLTANQLEFINLIINHLTQHGTIDISLLYESPFTDLTSKGPCGLFTEVQVNELTEALEKITATAVVPQGQQQLAA